MRRSGAIVLAAVAALALAACDTQRGESGYSGQVLSPPLPAKDFALRDGATGKVVRLSGLRGKAVLLTFVYTRCPDVCPLIMTNLGAALDKAGPATAKNARIVAVSVDPEGDTPARVKEFLRVRGLAGRADYLIGTKAQLAPVWKAYGIAVEATPDDRELGHTASVRGITASGKQKTIYAQNFSPTVVARDLPLLERD